MKLNKEHRIQNLTGDGGHIVILGAGASIASNDRNPEKRGKVLPSMNNFIDVLQFHDIIERTPIDLRASNFEELYSNLYNENPNSEILEEINNRIYKYFSDMELPDEATLYDYLILSLRPRDLIVTFNWDPFLLQAFYRNRNIADPPRIGFLHGNVAVGYSEEDNRIGPAGKGVKASGSILKPTKLLFPITNKNYTNDPVIDKEWFRLEYWLSLNSTKLLTIFGYGAPPSDKEAMSRIRNAYYMAEYRNSNILEIIDTKIESEGLKPWSQFVCKGKPKYVNDYFSSTLALNPRRTYEAYREHYFPVKPSEALSESNPIPNDFHSLKELQDWHSELIESENRWKIDHPDFEL